MHMYVEFQEQKTENPDIKCKNPCVSWKVLSHFGKIGLYLPFSSFFGGGVQVKILKIRAERGIKGNR